MYVTHPFPPLYDKDSRVLILGSFPSVKSREQMFFYGHPQNRFWKVIANVFNEPVPTTINEKKALLKRNHIALWDGIKSCKCSMEFRKAFRRVGKTLMSLKWRRHSESYKEDSI